MLYALYYFVTGISAKLKKSMVEITFSSVCTSVSAAVSLCANRLIDSWRVKLCRKYLLTPAQQFIHSRLFLRANSERSELVVSGGSPFLLFLTLSSI